jgi:AcrR family transcriptional regulator
MAGGTPMTLRQGELLDHAMALVREVGLAGLTVRRLAQRMGFSEAALYRHFPNKQALLLAMVERLSEERLLGPLRGLAADASRPPRERLARLVEHHLRTVLAVDGLPILILAEAAAAGDEALLARFRKIFGELLALLDGLLTELPAQPDRPSNRAVGVALFGVAAAAALHHRLFADQPLEEEMCARLPSFVVDGLLGGRDR